MSKETKRTVAIAKERATHQEYQKLNTKDGKDKIHKIPKTRQRIRQYKQSGNDIKDKDGKIVVEEQEIKTRWKTYFEELLNEENPREPLEKTHPVEGSKKK